MEYRDSHRRDVARIVLGAVWAFTQAPIALVAALRDSSILFAVVIAAYVLRETVGSWRWASACAVACGVTLMKV